MVTTGEQWHWIKLQMELTRKDTGWGPSSVSFPREWPLRWSGLRHGRRGSRCGWAHCRWAPGWRSSWSGWSPWSLAVALASVDTVVAGWDHRVDRSVRAWILAAHCTAEAVCCPLLWIYFSVEALNCSEWTDSEPIALLAGAALRTELKMELRQYLNFRYRYLIAT